MFVPLVLAGGSGTRLWPLSRQHHPKQFLALTGGRTMLQQTIGRLEGMHRAEPIVVCNEEQRFLAAEQLRQVGIENSPILLEPAARNTAPAIALGALAAMDGGDDPLLLALAADHHIADASRFQAAIRAAEPLAAAGRLVTFGIVPTRAETGYGYIRRGAADGAGYAVAAFVEKPAHDVAEGYLAAGDYFWNAGIFLFRASRILAEIEQLAPSIATAARAAWAGRKADGQFVRVDGPAFAASPSLSIDYAIMEKTADAAVVPVDAGWSDLGSWSALLDLETRDGDGNAFSGDVLAVGTTHTLARSDGRLVALVGVDDLIVVDTKDALLVARRGEVQRVREVVETLAAAGRDEHRNHRAVYRPWGRYDSIDAGPRDRVKRITVNPGARLSVQLHHHRAEHWVVVRGTARVLKGTETIMLTENQSIFIAVGEVHSLENPGRIPLELIEVQTGSYLGEDDIVRLEDRYGRT